MKPFLIFPSLLWFASSSAFQMPLPTGSSKPSASTLCMAAHEVDDDLQPVADRRAFLVGMAAFGIFAPASAHADEIKTLDMSLPSYGAINTLKSGSETEKALGVEAPVEAVGKAPKKKKASGGGGGGSPLGNVLPSMNKSVGKKSRNTGSATTSERPTKRVKEEKEADEIKTMDLSLPSYSEGMQGREKSAFSL